MNECRVIEELWIQLNPHCSIEGCEIDPAGSVLLWLWYNRNSQKQPLELNIGNPPRTVIRGLKNAIAAESRARRLLAPSGKTVIKDSEAGGNRQTGEVGERDK